MQRLSCIPEFYVYNPQRRIGDLIRDEVIPYMRSLAVLPTAMRGEALSRVEIEDVQTFFENLRRSWQEHNQLALEIDAFVMANGSWRRFEISEPALEQAITLFERADRNETEKRLYTAGVKEAIDKAMHAARMRYRLSDEEITLLLELPEPTYWAYRNGVHAQWLLARRGIGFLSAPAPAMATAGLCNIFHAGCEGVLNERRSDKWLRELLLMETEGLLRVFQMWTEVYTAAPEKRVKIGYLTLERPDLKAIQNLIRYDNLVELLFGANLWGVPDLFLRKMTINTLIRLGRIDARDSVLMYSVDELRQSRSRGPRALEARR